MKSDNILAAGSPGARLLLRYRTATAERGELMKTTPEPKSDRPTPKAEKLRVRTGVRGGSVLKNNPLYEN